MNDSGMTRVEKILLFIWLMINLGIGVFTVHSYGMSTDEPNNYRYAADTLAAYPSLFGILYEPKLDSSYEGHGPAFVAMASIVIRAIQAVFPDVFAPDLWHFSYFITFLLTGLCLYWLTNRWFSKWTAWSLLLLFSTQPLLWGHSFINPKDIPFMFFFTLSIVLGFRLVDGMEAREPFISLERPVRTLRSKYQQANRRRKKLFLVCLCLALAGMLAFAGFSRQIDDLTEHIVTYFYTASPDTLAGRLFSSFASQAANITMQDYVIKALKLLQRVEIGVLIAGILFFLVYFYLLISNRTLPDVLRGASSGRSKFLLFFKEMAKSVHSELNRDSLKTWFGEFTRDLSNPRLVFAGVTLGMATAVRAIAPLAGVIVVFYLLIKLRSRVWTTTIAYFLVAGIVTYIVWPYLWEAPIRNYMEELVGVSNFQNYSGQVLFNGEFYGIRDLPRLYLPTLLSIQFTEPVVLGIYIGIGILVWRILRDSIRIDLLLYIGMGFVLPLFGLILLNSPLYHNFRQVLFLVPAMFMFAAFTLELVFSKMIRIWARIVLIAVIVLPGVYATMQLYPYQYVYYNELVGGPAGVPNRYELDYWRTSMREMAIELNELAPDGSKIIIGGAASLFKRYAKADLVIETIAQNTYDLNGEYDYAVQLARWHNWELYPDAKIEVLIERGGAVLATVKAVRNELAK